MMRTYVRALEQPDAGGRRAATAARLPRRGRRAPLRGSGGVGDQLLRGPRQVGSEPRTGQVTCALRLDYQPLLGLRARLCLLLCPSNTQVFGLQRGAGLRAGDRREGERTRGAEGGVGEALVERRARGTGDEHRSVSVGGGEIQTDAGHLGGDARLRPSMFGADQVTTSTAVFTAYA